MQLPTLILTVATLLFPACASACVVPFIVLNGVNYAFRLQVQSPTHPSIDGRYVNFVGVGTPGDYRSVLAPAGAAMRVGFRDKKLSLAGMKHTAYLQSGGGSEQRVSFVIAPSTPLQVMARYACDENDKQQLVLVPLDAAGESGGKQFCVKKKAGEYGLYVKPLDDKGEISNQCSKHR
ncbi:hypothetical protein FN846DRAFT_955441 [Sphaerosporella brunnea]|uniref:Lipoprotein n=1 Tax=Sphaerosporella brunnea TaxID=1250544 RepID=A0A5J5ET17_9PEZI|nr:hypothetical protein FN846DRAFT_955441 [Sphaerosporella brunnea]